MAIEDKARWNAKYQNNKIPNEPIKLVKKYAHLTTGNQALDIACGMGRHSQYLASLGFEVDALDISSVAILHLQNRPHIHAKEVDFDNYTLEKNRYDLIVCTYFLERKLFAQMIAALRTDGILLIETFVHDAKNERISSNPAFLLNKGELEQSFGKSCEIVDLREFLDIDYQGFKAMKTSMVARKKGV